MDNVSAAQTAQATAGRVARGAAAYKRRSTGKHDPPPVSSGSAWAWRGLCAGNIVAFLVALAALVLSLQCSGSCDSAVAGDLTRTVAGLQADVATLTGTVASQQAGVNASFMPKALFVSKSHPSGQSQNKAQPEAAGEQMDVGAALVAVQGENAALKSLVHELNSSLAHVRCHSPCGVCARARVCVCVS